MVNYTFLNSKITRFIYAFLLVFITVQLKSQCFQIQSILVDACGGNQEGQNEMVTFQVGSVALNASNLSVNWPNNSWLGLIKNAGTAADVATVNSTIVGCGLLKEPVGNVLPANAKVLLITSSAWLPLAQSFANLNDTLYVIFQKPGNTMGHFANFGIGLRTLSISFSSPTGCNDFVTYDRALLINQTGTSSAQDGAAVEFSATGTASYVNHGCQAPFKLLSVNAGLDKAICVGGTQSFTASVTGAYDLITWSLGAGVGGTFTTPNALTTIYTPGIGESGTVKLYCSIIKVCGSKTSAAKDSVLLTITTQPTVSISPSAVIICPGGAAVVQSNTSPSVIYNWSTGATTSSASLNAAGVYTLNVSNVCGSASATVAVAISSAPTVSIVSSAPAICSSGQTAILSLVGSSGTYAWSNGSTTSTTSVSSPGVYSATVSIPGCSNVVANVTIGASPLPIVAIQSLLSNSVCAGGNIVLTANSTEGNYTWPGGVTTNTFSANTSPVVVTSTNSCGTSQATHTLNIISAPTLTLSSNAVSLCAGQSATVQANSNVGVNYSWSNGASTNVVSLSASGVYTVNATNICGIAFETVTVSAGTTPSVLAFATQTLVCSSVPTTTIGATGTLGTFLWNNGATTPTTSVLNSGVYTVTLTNNCGQAASSISITISSPPTLTISPATHFLCPSANTTLTATSTNAGNFIWNTGITGSNSIVVTSAGIYSVTASNLCGIKTVTASVQDVAVTPLVITASSYSICPNETAKLTATGGLAVGLSASSYVWSNSATASSVNITNGGIVTLSVTNFCGTYTSSVNIYVDPLSANIIADPISGDSPLIVSFTDNSINANTYLWDFGNGNSANSAVVPDQTYNTSGIYTVYLTVTHNLCIDKDSVTINVLKASPTLYVPNAFTPNGDNINDVFWIGATNIKDFHIIIFDRWGLKLFESNDLLVGWTGKVNGKAVADGCYVYLIEATGIDETDITKQGTVTLFK